MKTDYRDKILEALFQNYNITLEALFDYADAHQDAILDMDSIFNLETEEDARCFLVIPRLLDPRRAEAIIAAFREEEKESSFVAIEEPNTEQYALPLIAGFAYNPLFFNMAIDWCVRMGRNVDVEIKPNKPVQEIGRDPFFWKYLGYLNMPEAAGGEDVTPIGFFTINDDEQNIHGELRVIERDGGAEFIFRFAEYTEKPPYFIAVRGIGSKEIKLNHIRANNSSKNELSITSGKVSLFNSENELEYARIPEGSND